MDTIEPLARDLLLLKRQIRQLTEQEKTVKEKLLPLIREKGSVNLEDGCVSFRERKGARTFNRPEVLAYIRDAYGDALADQIDRDCTKEGESKEIIYVKLFDS